MNKNTCPCLFQRSFWCIIALMVMVVATLSGCDLLTDNKKTSKVDELMAESRVIGSACRHAGRGLEDCYRLNPEANKPAIFAGWKEMNEYMQKNKMQVVPPEIPINYPGGNPVIMRPDESVMEIQVENGEEKTTDSGKKTEIKPEK